MNNPSEGIVSIGIIVLRVVARPIAQISLSHFLRKLRNVKLITEQDFGEYVCLRNFVASCFFHPHIKIPKNIIK